MILTGGEKLILKSFNYAILFQCLQSYPQFQVIPHKLDVAKRLSQCLNPALPTGVHQRALDVYIHILTTIGVMLRSFFLDRSLLLVMCGR